MATENRTSFLPGRRAKTISIRSEQDGCEPSDEFSISQRDDDWRRDRGGFRWRRKTGHLFCRDDGQKPSLSDLNKMDVNHPMSFLYHSGMTTGGVLVADFDGDGKPDIFFAGTTGKNHLYQI